MERIRRGFTPQGICPICNLGQEDIFHLLRDYRDAHNFWISIDASSFYPHFFTVVDSTEWIFANLKSNYTQIDLQQWTIIFPLGIWYLWKRRNKVIFESPAQNPPMSKHFILQQALENTEAWKRASGVGHTISRSSTTFIFWSPPAMGWIAINTDGAAKGCPGLAGCAGVFRDSNGDWILGYQSALAGSSPESTFIDEFYANLNLEEQRGRVEFMEYDRKTPSCITTHLDVYQRERFMMWLISLGGMLRLNQRFYLLHDYMRIKVTIDITKPLKRRLQMKHPKGDWGWVDFKYERLSNLCFFCGLIGHFDRFCSKLLDHPQIPSDQFAYGSWLRADNCRSSNVGEKWLLSEAEVLSGGRSGGATRSNSNCAQSAGLQSDSVFESPNFVQGQ
ncbi:uncharacterized protein LOC122724918 [Manihot esculenta]|uniref:uncharacterized protein LOC122724918 n=1 Tax=Manihot esculenta TaxID=3983 RepID=UPI001CC4F34C|nr:uncharacterized protein LOC122724918 [Manihot esculenta]